MLNAFGVEVCVSESARYLQGIHGMFLGLRGVFIHLESDRTTH